MNKHQYSKATLFFLFLFCVKGNFLAAQQRPNIIFILTDDQRWDALGYAGNKIIKTPNLDALAAHGIYYKNAYVTTSICCVSRATILSGQYESRHKINDFSTDFSAAAQHQTYPILLKNAGYKIGFVGKYGVGTHPPDSLFDYWSCTEKVQPDYELKRSNGERIHNTDSTTNDALKFLNQFAGKEPFCLSISFKAPHELDGNPPLYPVQERFQHLYDNVTIPKPLTADPKYWNSFPDFFRTDSNIARVRWKYLFATDEAYQANVKKYYELVSGVDDAVGTITAQLKQLGIDQNTVIIFMGDNGFYLGEHGLEGKWFGHEESIRVPLIVYDPRPAALHGFTQQQIALNIDIAPTILSLAGLRPTTKMQGVSLVQNRAEKMPDRKSFFYEHTFLGGPQIPKVEGVVTKDFKYMKFIEHNYEMLYSIKNDPHETTNLAGDVRYKKKLEEMRKLYEKEKEMVR